MSSKCRWVLVFLVVAAACSAQTNSYGTGPGPAERARFEEVKQFFAASQYCAGVERLQQIAEPFRLFSSQGQWYEGTPSAGDVAESVASVWLKNGRVVAATISSETTAQAGIAGTTYCFREDGTLARVTVLPPVRSSGKAGLHAEVTVGRSLTYLPDGRSLQFPVPSYYPHVLKSERTTFRYVEPPAVYKTVDELPFIRLVVRQVQVLERHYSSSPHSYTQSRRAEPGEPLGTPPPFASLRMGTRLIAC
jgi:hypothetical protein